MATTEQRAAAEAGRRGGEIEAKMWPTSQKQVEMCRERGITDVDRTLSTDDVVQRTAMFGAAGVTSGSLLKGVTSFHQGARANTIKRTRCDVARSVDTIHLFSKDIHSEIRL